MANQNRGYTTNQSIFIRLQDERSDVRELSQEKFVERYGAVIAGFARNAGLRGQDVEDVVQDVLLSFFRVLPAFEYDPAKGRFRGYLKKATLTKIYEKARRNRVAIQAAFDDQADSDGHVENAWEAQWREQVLQRALREARSEFEPRTFEAFELNVLQAVPVTEVARRLDIAENSVHQAKTRVSRRIRKIVDRIRAEEG